MKKQTNKIECDLCGSVDGELTIAQKEAKAPFGQPVSYEMQMIHCKGCGESYTADKNEEILFSKAYRKSIMDSINKMLIELKTKGFSYTEIERCMELPPRTISRWKNVKSVSAISVALLRILATFPWIIRVAEKEYNHVFAKDMLFRNELNDAFEKLQTIIKSNTVEQEPHVNLGKIETTTSSPAENTCYANVLNGLKLETETNETESQIAFLRR